MPSDPREAAVTVSDLVVERGRRRVLHGVSAVIPTGQVTGLLGPSGSGKTTFMRALVGVQKVRSGAVTVLGLPAGSPALRRSVGYVTQAPSVYADLTVRENAHYFAALYGLGAAAADRALADVGMADAAGQLVRDLSGGQKGRVSLACALVAPPELLVLDEPTVGLDPVLRRDLWDLFHQLAARNVTLLVSSHVMDEATHCDLLILMRDGHILTHESPADLLARTNTRDAESAFLALIEHGPAVAK